MIVIDTSALAKYILKEEGWRGVYEVIRTNSPIYSIDLMLKEIANVIWKYVKRRLINDEIALELFDAVIDLVDSGVILLEPERDYLRNALEIALHSSVTVYDSLYIAQAMRRGSLLTSDKEQADAARRLGISVIQM